MAIFNTTIEVGALVVCDQRLKWHLENQNDDNRYIDVRSQMLGKNTKWLESVNTLIKLGYEPKGGIASDQANYYQAMYRKS